MIEPNDHDAFVVTQKLKLVRNEYDIALPDGTPVAYVRQKAFALKEELIFSADERSPQPVMTMKARQRFDPRATYDVRAPDGTLIGTVRKAFGASLLRSTYVLSNAEDVEIATAHERKMWVALFRRLIGAVPYVGDFANWLPIPYDFVFFDGDQELATHSRRRGKFKDTYDVDMSADTQRKLDRRLVLAIAVGLDALQAR